MVAVAKFADDTVVVGLISDNTEKAYLEEVTHLENCCRENNLFVNISTTKELIVDFGRKWERKYPTPQAQPGHGGEGGQLQIPQCLHHTAFIMVLSCQYLGEESLWASLPLQMPKLLQAARQDTKDFPHLHRRERPDRQHYCLVWEQH